MKIKIKGWKKEEQRVSIIDRTCIHRYDKAIPTFKSMERQLVKSLKACR